MRAVYDLVDLPPIIQAVRQLPNQDDDLGPYLPLAAVDTLDYRLTRTTRTDQVVPARALDTPAVIIARPGVIEIKGGIPAFSAMDLLTESDLQQLRRVLAAQQGQASADAWQLTAAAAATNAAATILNTLILLQGQALFTGGLSVAVRGTVPQTVDFGLHADQKVAASIAWTSVATAPALSEILAWNDTYARFAGQAPGVMLLSRQYLALLARNKEVIDAIKGSAAGVTRVSVDDINSLLASHGAAPVRPFDRTLGFEDPATGDMTQTRVAAANRFALLPAAGTPVGRTQLGPTEEAAELAANRVLALDQLAGIAIVPMVNDDPPQRAMKAAATGLPVIEDSRRIMCGTLS